MAPGYVFLVLALTACGSAAQMACPKQTPVRATPTELTEKEWKEGLEPAADHVAFLVAVGEHQPADSTLYRKCIADALERLPAARHGECRPNADECRPASYVAAMKLADQEMTWCYSTYCVPVRPQETAGGEGEIYCLRYGKSH